MSAWMRVPVVEPLTAANVWEHTPLDYYRYGEYPRFIRPVGVNQPKTEWQSVSGQPRATHQGDTK
jgi:hypothetical protein